MTWVIVFMFKSFSIKYIFFVGQAGQTSIGFYSSIYIYKTMQYTLDGTGDIILQFREKGDRRTRRYINA